MPERREFPISLRILLPLLAAGALLLAPRADGLDAAFQAVSVGNQWNQPVAVAVRLLDLARWEPWRLELWQQAGQLAVRGGDIPLSISSLEQALRLGLLDDGGRLSLGEAYWANQDPAAALNAWEPLVVSGRAPEEIYQRAMDYHRTRNEWEETVRIAQAWWQVYPRSGQAAWAFGILGLALGTDSAPTALWLSGSLTPARAEAGQVLLGALQQVMPDAPQEYRAVQVGRALGGLGEWEMALLAFERAQRINPAYAEAWAFSGEAKQHLEQSGLPELERSLALAPDSATLQALVGIYYRRKLDPQKALQYFQVAAALEPQRGIWQVEIGNSYAELHNTQKGLEFYRKAAELEPQNPAIWRLVAQYCLNHDLAIRESGLPAARQVIVLEPNHPASADLMGQVLLALGDEISAERFLQQSIARNMQFPAAYLHLGQLYLRQNRMDWAEYFLARAAQMPGEDAEAVLLAQRLLERYFGAQ